jgi:hypothetical protein
MPGPLAKPPEERARRNKTGEDGLGDEIFEMDGEVKPPSGIRFLEPEVQAMWDALKKSVNRKFYEPTDWAYAVLTLKLWDNALLKKEVPSAMLLQALDGMLAKMLMTEGDRRRLKIFARREKQEDETKTKSSNFYREAFEEQRRARLRSVSNEETG